MTTTTIRTFSWERRAAAKRARVAAAAAADPRYTAPPADVRAAGFRAMTAAAETTVDLGQVYARTLDALWPHAVAVALQNIDAQLDTEIGPEVELAVEQLVDADTAPMFCALRVPAPTSVEDGVPVWGVPDGEETDPVPPVSVTGAGGGMVALDSGPLAPDVAGEYAARIVAAVGHLRGEPDASVDAHEQQAENAASAADTRPFQVMSFGYLHGPPPRADLVMDLRPRLRDPHTDPELRELTGHDARIIAKVEATDGFCDLVDALVEGALALADAGDKPVRVAVGCAGGRHRSVVVAETVAAELRAVHVPIEQIAVRHLDIGKPVVRRGGGR